MCPASYGWAFVFSGLAELGLFFLFCVVVLDCINGAITMATLPTPEVTLIPMSALTKSERFRFENIPSPYGNPAKALERKIEHLARLLNCTEEEATHILLHNL